MDSAKESNISPSQLESVMNDESTVVHNQSSASNQGVTDSSVIKSKSFDIPARPLHINFDTTADPSTIRPAMNRSSVSHNDAYEQKRPPIYTHRSFTTSVSSFSLYSHFAGEKFGHRKHSLDERRLSMKRHSSPSLRAMEKGGSSTDKQSSATSSQSDVCEKDVTEEDSTPKASVGKAMFMFLKAFIGSGVLFLPKA